VASAVIYTPVANLTALAALTPTNGDYFELTDSTGAESSALITGVTVGLVGAPGLTFRLRYDAPPGIFTFLGYFANDSETRYLKLQGGTVTGNLEIGTTGSLTFEGSTANAFETTVAVVDPTADRTITLPNVTGTVVTTGDTGTVTSTMILDGTIVDGDVNASAAIAGTKISPNFGSQNVVTTGTSSAAALIPTGSSVPTNGVYLPSANNVAISTNGSGRLYVDATGLVGINQSSPGSALDVAGEIRIYPSSGAGNLRFGSGGVEKGKVSVDASSNYTVETAGSERLRIDSSGRLGLGTTSPDANSQLHVVGSSYQPLYINTTGTGGGGAAFLRSGTQALYVGTAGSSWLSGSSTADGLIRSEANLIFGIGNNERMRIDSSGRVGIGTTSPATPLHVEVSRTSSTNAVALTFSDNVTGTQTNGVYKAIRSTSNNSASVSEIRFLETDGTNNNTGIAFATQSTGGGLTERGRWDNSGRLLVGTSTAQGTSIVQVCGNSTASTDPGDLRIIRGLGVSSIGANVGAALGYIRFGTFEGAVGATIEAQSDATWSSTSDTPGRLVFSTTADGASSPTERMRISNNGILDTFSSVSSTFLPRSTQGANTSNQLIQGCYGAANTQTGTVSFIVYTNGNVQNTNNSYGQISDVKLKENIVDAGSQWSDLKAVRVRNFNFKEGQTHRQIGVIAQELEEVSPGLVYETPDRDEDGNETGEVTKGVNYSVLYMKAVKALQEAMERIEQLESEMAEVKAQLQAS
jgi:hypothetical protein